MTNSTSGRTPSSHWRISSNGPNRGRHSSSPVFPASYTCSMDGACDAPIPPITRAIPLSLLPSGLPHLLADLDQRRPRDTDQLDHGVDRHPSAPQLDPVASPDQVALLIGEAELGHPPLFVLLEQLALITVLQRERR